MILDQNKNISEIRYNHLNLPKKVTLTHGEIAYTYDALGNKWFKYVGESNGQAGDEKHGTAYLFGFQYSFKYNEVVEYDWKLMHIATSEGYVSAVYPQGIGGNFKLHYVYNHTDHLGNIRQNITRKGNEIDILKEDNYYPFGLTHRGYNEQKEELKYDPEQDRIFTIQAQASRYRYQYNGKEWQEDVGVNWYDYGARNYDAALGRWFNVDPLAEKYPDLTAYNYTANNPVIFVDPDGRYFIVKDKELQKNIIKALATAFNGKTDAFSFDKNGRLSIDKEKLGNLNDDQQFLFDSFNKDVVTNEKNDLVIEESNEATQVSYEQNDRGGWTGTVKLNINQPDFDDKMRDTEDGTINGDSNYKATNSEKRATAIFHEVGHFREDIVYMNNGDSKSTKIKKAVGYENVYRRIRGFKERIGRLHGIKKRGKYLKKYQGQCNPTGYKK